MAIKQVNEIPVKARPKSRAYHIRQDVREALDKKIDKFEFVGEIYENKYIYQQVKGLAFPIVKDYVMGILNAKLPSMSKKKYWEYSYRFVDDTFKVYRHKDANDVERTYMEIYYDLIEECTTKLAEDEQLKAKEKARTK